MHADHEALRQQLEGVIAEVGRVHDTCSAGLCTGRPVARSEAHRNHVHAVLMLLMQADQNATAHAALLAAQGPKAAELQAAREQVGWPRLGCKGRRERCSSCQVDTLSQVDHLSLL